MQWLRTASLFHPVAGSKSGCQSLKKLVLRDVALTKFLLRPVVIADRHLQSTWLLLQPLSIDAQLKIATIEE